MVPPSHLLLCSDTSVVAWLDDSTRVDSNFQADRGNKELGQSRDCTKWDHHDGLSKHSAWTVLAGFIHTATTGAWERTVLPWLYMLTLQSTQAWSKANHRIRQHAVINEYRRVWIRMFISNFWTSFNIPNNQSIALFSDYNQSVINFCGISLCYGCFWHSIRFYSKMLEYEWLAKYLLALRASGCFARHM